MEKTNNHKIDSTSTLDQSTTNKSSEIKLIAHTRLRKIINMSVNQLKVSEAKSRKIADFG